MSKLKERNWKYEGKNPNHNKKSLEAILNEILHQHYGGIKNKVSYNGEVSKATQIKIDKLIKKLQEYRKENFK